MLDSKPHMSPSTSAKNKKVDIDTQKWLFKLAYHYRKDHTKNLNTATFFLKLFVPQKKPLSTEQTIHNVS